MTTIATTRKFRTATGEGWYVVLNSGYRFGPMLIDQANDIAAAINTELRSALSDMAAQVAGDAAKDGAD